MRIHYHTDCHWFGGSEMVLLLHLDAAFDSADMEPVFTYRAGSEYEAGLRARLTSKVPAKRLRLPDPFDLKQALSRGRSPRMAKALRGGFSLLQLPLKQICMVWDVGRMYVELRRSRPDVLHINNGGFPGAISCNATAIAAHLARVPVVVYVVNNIAVPLGRPSRALDYPVDRLVARSVDLFVTASPAAGRALRSVLRLPETQHRVIPNATQFGLATASAQRTRQELGVPSGRLVVLVMAILDKRKGHQYLLDALPQLPQAIRLGMTLVIAGDGPERGALEDQSRARGISSQVLFLGERTDRWSLYEAADVIVLPSISYEDMPIVILDAMAASRPVVATTVAGIPEQVVDGVTGRLVAPSDSVALAAALADVLADSDARAAMGAAARERYEALFTPKRFIDAYRREYASLLTRRVSSRSEDVGASA